MAKKSFDQSMSIVNNKIKVTCTATASKGTAAQAKWQFTRKFKVVADAQRFVDQVRSYTMTGAGNPVNSRALNALVATGVPAGGRNYYKGPDRPASQVRAR